MSSNPDNNDPHDVMMDASGTSDATDLDLLLQFQCMGTNDRDALIMEFQRLLGPVSLQPEACAFFLEMNNWNLQQAICSYFDCDLPKELMSLPSMTLIKDVTIGDGEEVPPNTTFTKTWKIVNSGQEPWPYGCCLKFLVGDQMTNQDKFPVEALQPGQSVDLSVSMTSPSAPGTYQGQWRMQTMSGMFFGEVIWVIISVAEGGLLGLTQQMNNFHSLGSSPPEHPQVIQASSHQASSSSSFINNSSLGDGSHSLHRSLSLSTPSSHHHNIGPQTPPVLTVTSPDFSTVDLTRPSGLLQQTLVFHNSKFLQQEQQGDDDDGMTTDDSMTPTMIPPLPVKRVIDRVKEVTLPNDDNRENCIQICRDILIRSNSVSPGSTSPCSSNAVGIPRNSPSEHGRRGSIGFSPLATSDMIVNPLRSASFSSPPASTSSTPSSASRTLFQPPQQPGLLQQQHQPQHQEQQADVNNPFPPTPPSEDMML